MCVCVSVKYTYMFTYVRMYTQIHIWYVYILAPSNILKTVPEIQSDVRTWKIFSHLYLRWTKLLSLHIFVDCSLSQKRGERIIEKEKKENETFESDTAAR